MLNEEPSQQRTSHIYRCIDGSEDIFYRFKLVHRRITTKFYTIHYKSTTHTFTCEFRRGQGRRRKANLRNQFMLRRYSNIGHTKQRISTRSEDLERRRGTNSTIIFTATMTTAQVVIPCVKGEGYSRAC